jgi:RNA polymerase sigma-70 factor, ECF subfamily
VLRVASLTMPTPSADLGSTFAALRAPLGAYLRKRVRDPAAAEDLLQQVFLKALTAIRGHQSIGNLPGWLYKVARTTAIDHHRSHPGLSIDLSDDIATDQSDDHDLEKELASCLRPLAQSLPAIYRDTLIALDFESQSVRSVADSAELSQSAIKSRASRARRLLKSRLLECCEVEMSNGALDACRRKTGGCCSKGCS